MVRLGGTLKLLPVHPFHGQGPLPLPRLLPAPSSPAIPRDGIVSGPLEPIPCWHRSSVEFIRRIPGGIQLPPICEELPGGWGGNGNSAGMSPLLGIPAHSSTSRHSLAEQEGSQGSMERIPAGISPRRCQTGQLRSRAPHTSRGAWRAEAPPRELCGDSSGWNSLPWRAPGHPWDGS